MTKKATEDELAELHGEFARYLKSFMKRSKRIMDSASDDEVAEPNASVLNVVKSFLKDNGIEADVGDSRRGDFSGLMAGLDELPFQTEDKSSGSH